MAGNQLALTWDLIARDAASPAFLRVAGAADKAAASTETAAAKTEAASARMGAAVKAIALGATAGIVAFGVESVHMAADFQKSMLLVQTQAGASAAEVRKMTPAILSLAGKTAQAPEALATSLYHVESTGLRGAKALNAVQIAAEGARVGNADLEQTTNALTATIASGMLPATESYAQAMGQLNTIVGSGDMKMQDLNDAFSTGVLVRVKQYGVNINDVGAALADFGDNNIRGADAATQLRMAVQAIATPSVKAAAELGKIGLTVDQLRSDQETGGLNKALTDLHTHLVNSGIDATKWGGLLTDAFTKKAGGGVLTLIGTFSRFEQKFKEVSGGADSFGKAWAATTKSAAFQAAALGDNIKALAIEAGQHLLPAVTATMGWINQNAIPALEHLGTGALNAARWFGQLPAPIKDTALALGALGLSRAIGLTGLLAGGVARVGTAFAGASGGVRALADQMAVQARLGGMEAASIGEVDAALGGLSVSAGTAAGSLSAAQLSLLGWDAALAQTVVEEDVAVAATGRLSAAMATTAVAGMGGLRAAGSGLLAMLGGPWVAGLAAAAGAVLFLKHESDGTTAAVKAQTEALLNLMKTQDAGGDAGKKASQKLQDFQDHINSLQHQIDQASTATIGGGKQMDTYGAKMQASGDKVAGLRGELAKAKDEMSTYRASLTPAQTAQIDLTRAQNEWNSALAHNPSNSMAVAMAASNLRDAQKELATATQQANDAAKTQIERAQEQQTNLLGLLDAQRASAESQLQLKDAIAQYNADAKDGQHSTGQLKEEQLGLADSAEQAAKSAGDAAAKQAKLSGATDTSFASQAAFIKSLQDTASQLTGPAKQAVLDMIKTLGGQKYQADVTAAAVSNLGITVTDLPSEHMITIDAPTDKQMQALQDLGYETVHLPNGQIVVSADTHPAQAEILDLLNYARQQSILYRATLPDLNGSASGSGRPGLAAGGWVRGPGGPTSDSVPIMGSNGEFMVNAAAAQANSVLLEAINAGHVKGFASGGWVNVPPGGWYAGTASVPVNVQDAGYKAGIHSALAATAASFAPNAPANAAGNIALGQSLAGAYGWTGLQWQALYNLWMRESGWNNNAQNPTSTAYGIPQFLNSTWASVGVAKTSDPRMQEIGGLRYIAERYGTPVNAWSHELSAGWYDGGGYLPPGLSLAMNGTGKSERVRTAEQEAALIPEVNVQVLIDGQEFRGMAKTVVNGRLQDWDRQRRFH